MDPQPLLNIIDKYRVSVFTVSHNMKHITPVPCLYLVTHIGQRAHIAISRLPGTAHVGMYWQLISCCMKPCKGSTRV